MSTTENGYIIDISDEEGVAIIPAPPSPSVGVNTVLASVGSSLPSRESVSAAIALVRAKQVAKSAILRAEEQILQPLSVSSDKASTSVTAEASTKDKVTIVAETAEIENAAPGTSLNRDRSFSCAEVSAITCTSSKKNISSSSYSDEVHELPQKPSYEENHSNQLSVPISIPSDNIPRPPSLDTNENIFDETRNTNTIDDVNAFLSRLGVGALHSASNESNNSIDRMRMLSSSSSSASSDVVARSDNLKPERENSVVVVSVVEKENGPDVIREVEESPSIRNSIESEPEACSVENDKTEDFPSRLPLTSEFLREDNENDKDDPPSTFTPESQNYQTDPAEPTHLSEGIKTPRHDKRENPFIDHSFSCESVINSHLPSSTVVVEDDRKIDEKNSDEVVHEDEIVNQIGDKTFPVDVRKTLSTVEEVASMEAENECCNGDDNNRLLNDTENCSDTKYCLRQGIISEKQPSTLRTATSDEQKSVCGVEGRKEPRGYYEKVGVEVEKIPVSNIGVEQAIESDMSLMSTDSHQVGSERDELYVKDKTLGIDDIHDSGSCGGSRGLSDTGSLPWALRDVASEETLRATGRRRPQFVVSGPRPSNKSRNTASLFDDASQQASETASEYRKNRSFASEDGSAKDYTCQNDEDMENKTSGSCNTNYDGDDTRITDDNEGKDSMESSNCSVDENSEVYFTHQLGQDPSGDKSEFEVEKGLSLTQTNSTVSAMDDQCQNRGYLKELILSIIDGQRPSMVEIAHIREAAKKANITLETIDRFLDYVAEAKPDDLNLLSKIWEKSNLLKSLELSNEGDTAVEIFFGRFETARVAVTKKPSPDAALGTSLKAEEEAEKELAAVPLAKEHSNSFLCKFEELEIEDDQEAEGQSDVDEIPVCLEGISEGSIVDITSPATLVKYFSNIEQHVVEGESQGKPVSDFKKLLTPVIHGYKPTVIEEAQIRQAALKANISLDYVDAFVDFVKNENAELLPYLSSEVEPDFLMKGNEDFEDLDEDDAIAAFLSSKSGDESLDEVGEVRKYHVKSKKAEDTRKKEPTGITVDQRKDYQSSESAIVENYRFFGKESEVFERELNKSGKDLEAETNLKSNDALEVDNIGYETSASDGLDESVMSRDEVSNHNDSFSDSIDTEMLNSCQSIESYDAGIWQRRSAMATYGWGWEEATWLSPKASQRAPNLTESGVNRVTATKDLSNFLFNKKSFPLARKRCKLSYNRRVRSHAGYFEVDMYSLQESAAVGEKNQFKDETPWELRRVRQKFLHERSLSFSRNWFGDLVVTNGNDKIRTPICKPKSMEMPMRKIPDPGDWTPEWYTTWGGRKLLLRKPSCETSVDSGFDSYSETEKEYNDKDSLRSFTSDSSYEEYDEDWEDAPECGTFVNTKQKIGEHVTRVHPDYTSSLRKSRWRKKYFPIGTFPY